MNIISSRILALVLGTAISTVLSSVGSPVAAITYSWSYSAPITPALANTSGQFTETAGIITSWTGTVNGLVITSLLPPGTFVNGFARGDNLYPFTGNGVTFTSSDGEIWSLFDEQQYRNIILVNRSNTVNTYYIGGGSFVANPVSVPFIVKDYATIPTLGSLFALAVMRKVRKSIASKSYVANSVITVS